MLPVLVSVSPDLCLTQGYSAVVVERRSIVVVGAGGFGRDTLDVIEDLNVAESGRFDIVGVVDHDPSERNLERLHDRGIRYLGDDETWLRSPNAECFAVGIGDPRMRKRLTLLYKSSGLNPATLVHPTVVLGRRTVVGEGSVICAGAVVSTNVQIGESVTINANATIGHDSRLHAFVSINPGAIVSGEVSIGDRTLIGAGAVVLEGRIIGSACVIGAGACVTRDVADGLTVTGIPARSSSL